MLTAARLREILHYDPDTGAFTWRVSRKGVRAGAAAGTLCQGYYRIMADRRSYQAHRLAWLYMTGAWPEAEIDHINLARADNCWCNLREATRVENQRNTSARPNNTSGFKGVVWHKSAKRWRATITADGKQCHLGYFDTPQAAAAAYADAAKKLFGEFARAS